MIYNEREEYEEKINHCDENSNSMQSNVIAIFQWRVFFRLRDDIQMRSYRVVNIKSTNNFN